MQQSPRRSTRSCRKNSGIGAGWAYVRLFILSVLSYQPYQPRIRQTIRDFKQGQTFEIALMRPLTLRFLPLTNTTTMAAVTGIRTRILSHQRLSKGTFSATHRNASSWTEAALRKELTSRRLPLSYDYLTPLPSHLLTLSLSDFLPDIFQAPKILPSVQQPQHLPPGYHLIYFPPQVPPSQLLPDGTDLLHSPGAPFNRRLWAGGNVFFPTPKENLLLNGQRAVCVEKISDVNVRGAVGDEKVFVTIDRRFSTVQEGEDPEETRNRVLNSREVLTEQRTLAFLQDRKPEHTNSPNLAGKNSRLVKCRPRAGPGVCANGANRTTLKSSPGP